MATSFPSPIHALHAVEKFIGSDLTARIADLENAVMDCDAGQCTVKSVEAGATSDLLAAAYSMKQAVGQINVLIHAVGGLLLLPKIMEPGEKIEYVSLGAGNSGRAFDLETDRRVAEFKFIHWRGRANTIRQNALFKDFYMLAENPTKKRKELYVLDRTHPLKFLRSKRAISSVLSRNVKLWKDFQSKYVESCETVFDYYTVRKDDVLLCDAQPHVPELVPIVDIALVESEPEV